MFIKPMTSLTPRTLLRYSASLVPGTDTSAKLDEIQEQERFHFSTL